MLRALGVSGMLRGSCRDFSGLRGLGFRWVLAHKPLPPPKKNKKTGSPGEVAPRQEGGACGEHRQQSKAMGFRYIHIASHVT